MSSRAQYREIACKSALNAVKGMEFRWSLNPYRGCVHGCHYCFARRYHAYFELNPGDDFTGVVFVKTNIPRVLREELWLPSWRRETVAIGIATDPYQPIEGKYRLTRRCLEAFAERRSPIGLITKGPMVIRDVDVLSAIAKARSCTVCVSVTTLDEQLARKLEPTTAPPLKRLMAVQRLAEAGVHAGVLVAPVVPGITDSQVNLEDVARGAASHGARFLSGRALYLKPGTKEHFMGFLEREFPQLLLTYQRLFPDALLPKRLQNDIDTQLHEARDKYDLAERTPSHATARDIIQTRMAI